MKAIFALKNPMKIFEILNYTVYRDGIFYATDIEMHIACRFPVPGLPDGAMMPRAWLKTVYEHGGAQLVYADGKINGITIPEGLPAEDTPAFPVFRGGALMSVPIAELRGVGLAMANQDIRYYLNGMYVDFAGARIAATDGHRAHTVGGLEVAGKTAGVSAIIPNNAINMAIRCASKGRVVPIAYDPVAQLVQMQIGDTTITTKVIDGRYPDIDRVIPRAEDRVKGMITIQGKRGIADMRRFTQLAKVAGAELPRSARFMHGKISNGANALDCESIVVNGGVEFRANAAYISDAISFMGQDACEFLLEDCESSALVVHGARTAIIMPLRV